MLNKSAFGSSKPLPRPASSLNSSTLDDSGSSASTGNESFQFGSRASSETARRFIRSPEGKTTQQTYREHRDAKAAKKLLKFEKHLFMRKKRKENRRKRAAKDMNPVSQAGSGSSVIATTSPREDEMDWWEEEEEEYKFAEDLRGDDMGNFEQDDHHVDDDDYCNFGY